MRKLSDEQKLARKIIRQTARDLIREADMSYRRGATRFNTYFHIDCIGPCKGHIQGHPLEINYRAMAFRRAALALTPAEGKP